MSEVKESDFMAKIQLFWRKARIKAKKAKKSALIRFTHWVDPKLAPYRVKNDVTRAIGAENSPKMAENPALSTKISSKTPEMRPEAPEAGSTPSLEKSSRESTLDANTGISDEKDPQINDFRGKNQLDIPTSREEFLEIFHNIPLAVFSRNQRKQFEAILNLDRTSVSELMLPKKSIVYVDKDEVMGPLTLDRLFRSGMEHFPVTDSKKRVIGCIHTARLNSLDIKQSSKAGDILDPNVYYAREDYTLEQALDVFLRTESYFLLIVDKFGRTKGILNFSDLSKYLFGNLNDDGFMQDNDHLAVAGRRFAIELDGGKQRG